MDFVANKEPQIQAMKKELGINDILELYKDIPDSLLIKEEFNEGISEYEGLKLIETIAAKNTYHHKESYLGFGAYEHQIPAATSALIKKSEFLTSYTPYQAEASQGMLQAIFEYQSMAAALTGLDVSNASVYDGGSALAESALMALRHNKKDTLIMLESVHPSYRAIVKQYTESLGFKIRTIPFDRKTFKTDLALIKEALGNASALIIQSPNAFGRFEETQEAFKEAKAAGALSILSANPIVYGYFSSAKELGADIAAGDLQPLGIPLQYGGPYAGYLTCKEELMRQLPGRIVGKTVDAEGRTGYVLTLQAREQHIRREKATSNICTNQALSSLASLITALWYGPEGLEDLSLMNYQKAAYLKNALEGCTPSGFDFFNEFPVTFNKPAREVLKIFRESGIEAGIPLDSYYEGLQNTLLVAVTEVKNKEMLDRYAALAKEINHG